jgi:hypothetical protein
MRNVWKSIVCLVAAVGFASSLAIPLDASAASSTRARLTGPRAAWTPLGIPASEFYYAGSHPGLYRTSDGVLHAAYVSKYSTANGSKYRLMHLALSQTGHVLRKNVIVGGFGTMRFTPQLVAGPNGGLRAIFVGGTGLQNDFFQSGVFTAVSDKSGSSWTVPNERIGVTAPDGLRAAAAADGTPVVVWTAREVGSSGWLRWHVGTGTTPDPGIHFDISPSSADVVRDGNRVYLTWVVRAGGSTAPGRGVWVKQILPSEGPAVRAPNSVTSDGVYNPGEHVAIAGRRGGGTWLAYCRGSDINCYRILLWKVGTSTTYTLPHPGTGSGTDRWASINLSMAPGGRLWVAWRGAYGLTYALRTGTNGHTFGALRVLGETGFNGCCQQHLDVEGSGGPLHMFRSDVSTGPNNRVIDPGLSLSADPTRWRAAAGRTVTFTVRDAGSAVRGASVKAHGKACQTNRDGKCRISFAAMGASTFAATATKPGYYRAIVTLRATAAR